MSNVLEFTLGLTTGSFLSRIEEARGKVLGFVGGMLSLEKITEGVKGAFEQGAGLNELAKRTGQSVSDLYKLQRGFTSAGLSADSVGSIIYRMSKSLGGVNEMGEKTGDVFGRLGLRIEDLRSMDAPAALQAILNSFGRLNQSSAASAAGSIFGREGAQSMLQLSRSANEFAEGVGHAAVQARIFQRNAGAFEQVERAGREIKENFKSVFAGIAEGVAPAVLAIEKMLAKLDLSGLGQSIGKYLTALTQAFSEGKLTELIALSLRTGFEMAVAAAPLIFQKLGYILLKVFETPLNYLQAGMTYAIEQMANNPLVRAAMSFTPGGAAIVAGLDTLGISHGGKAAGFQEILKDQMEHGLKFDLGSGEFGFEDMAKDLSERSAATMARFKVIGSGLEKMINDLAARAPKPEAGEKSRAGTGDILMEAFRSKPTDLQKMGFVMRGVGATDHAADTARNTGKTADLVSKIHDKLTNTPSVPMLALTNSHP